MKKKWVLSVSLATGLLALPLMGFSSTAQSKMMPNQVTLESGGIGVPIGVGPFSSDVYHEPVDGIISTAVGCIEDVHTFDKSYTGVGMFAGETEKVLFTAGVNEITTQEEAQKLVDAGFKIFVEIKSNGQKVMEREFYLHPFPDPNNKKPFWVSPLPLGGANAVDLPTGDYNYQFKAKDGNGHVLGVWVPKNHKFTVVDSSEN